MLADESVQFEDSSTKGGDEDGRGERGARDIGLDRTCALADGRPAWISWERCFPPERSGRNRKPVMAFPESLDPGLLVPGVPGVAADLNVGRGSAVPAVPGSCGREKPQAAEPAGPTTKSPRRPLLDDGYCLGTLQRITILTRSL